MIFDIACIGTSLTADINVWQNFVRGKLQEGCAKSVRTYNFGNPGKTSAYGLSIMALVASMRPKMVLIEFAMNDANTSIGMSLATFKANLGTMVDFFRANDPAVIVALMTMNPAISPGSSAVPNLATYYQGVRDIAALKSTVLIDNTPLWGTPTSTQIPDGIHPTAVAVQAIAAPNMVSVIHPLI